MQNSLLIMHAGTQIEVETGCGSDQQIHFSNNLFINTILGGMLDLP